MDAKSIWGVGYCSGRDSPIYNSDSNPYWQSLTSASGELLKGVWSSGDGSGFIVGNRGTLLGKGPGGSADMGADAWLKVPVNTMADLNAVWGFAGNDVWVVGSGGTVLHYGDSGWEKVSIMPTTTEHLWAVWGSSPNDVWVVGNGGTVYHYP